MNTLKRNLTYSLLCCFWWAQLASADDTDIYINNNRTGNAPYLMFMMDYRSDLGSTFCSASGGRSCANVLAGHPELLAAVESVAGVGNKATNIQALVAVLKVVFAKFDGIYVGLMVPNNSDGGTLLRGYELFQEGDLNGAKSGLINIINSIPIPSQGNQFHETAPKETHYEWYAYVNGDSIEQGKNTSDNFQNTNTPSYDASLISGHRYISPFANTPANFECAKLYEVYATSGNSGGRDNDLDGKIRLAMNGADSYEKMVEYTTNEDVLRNVPGEQNLKTWFIQMGSAATLTDDWAEAAGSIDQYMNVGGGDADLFDVQTKLEAAFIEALSVSTTFVAASVPVNVFNRTQSIDNFYIALFEAQSSPRWPGNLKKLVMRDNDDDGLFDEIIDVNSRSAFNEEDGRIKYEALTFWTDSTALSAADPSRNEVTSRDGRSVERGGAGQMIPGFIRGNIGDLNSSSTRNLYYEPSRSGNFLPFNADASTVTTLTSDLRASSASEALNLIKWARGQDVDDEDNDRNIAEARPWVLGDSIHSRPLAVNYGATPGYSESNPNIRLFFGTNDGVFHVIENTAASTGAESGKEVMGFMPRELMSNLSTLKANGVADHPYGVDGEPVSLVKDHNANGTIETAEGDAVYLFFGLRRGGKSYYALDASNPSGIPSYIGMLTKSTGGHFDELGYTFSTPKVVKIRYDGIDRDVLIFAGGYDTNKDGTPLDSDGSRSADSEGNAIFIVDISNGELLWKVTDGASTEAVSNNVYTHSSMDYSIPSDVATLDADRNGIVDRLYVGDTGGNVWRVDLPEGGANSTDHRRLSWKATILADLSDSAENEDRRFFHRPDIVQTRSSNGIAYDAVIIGSGDRANPLETVDDNALFVIKDTSVISGRPSATPIDDDSLTDVTLCATSCTGLDYQYGWKMELTNSGEKGLSSPLVSNGKIFFTSYSPNVGGGNTCAPAEGSGSLYIVDLGDGAASFDGSRGTSLGPGIPASAISLSGGQILVPGTGVEDPPEGSGISSSGNLVNVEGSPAWILYWNDSGKDSL